MDSDFSMIEANLKEVRKRIICAAQSVGRDPEEITLIAVSKTKPIEMVEAAYQCEQRVFGENKVQEICEKSAVCEADIRWHMIGHLQTNKVRQVVDKVEMIHSVESVKLLEEIQKESEKRNLVSDILIEVNIGDEDSKFGLKPTEIVAFAEKISQYKNVRLRGLMTVAPYTENAEDNRKFFKQMKQLFIDIKEKNIDNSIIDTLSMGMTGDYEVAIQEGATMVRVGTGIFGERNYNI